LTSADTPGVRLIEHKETRHFSYSSPPDWIPQQDVPAVYYELGITYGEIRYWISEFPSIAEAQRVVYLAGKNWPAASALYGSFTGSLLGDRSWMLVTGDTVNSIYVVKNNMGLHIYLPGGDTFRQEAVEKIVVKMEAHSKPPTANPSISLAEYDQLVKFVTELLPSGSSILIERRSIWEMDSTSSPYKVGETSYGIGWYREWRTPSDRVIGIDIDRFDSDSLAVEAAYWRSRSTNSCLYPRPDEMQMVRSSPEPWYKFKYLFVWQLNDIKDTSTYTWPEFGSKRLTLLELWWKMRQDIKYAIHPFVFQHGRYVVQISQFSPEGKSGIDVHLFPLMARRIAGQIPF